MINPYYKGPYPVENPLSAPEGDIWNLVRQNHETTLLEIRKVREAIRKVYHRMKAQAEGTTQAPQNAGAEDDLYQIVQYLRVNMERLNEIADRIDKRPLASQEVQSLADEVARLRYEMQRVERPLLTRSIDDRESGGDQVVMVP